MRRAKREKENDARFVVDIYSEGDPGCKCILQSRGISRKRARESVDASIYEPFGGRKLMRKR